MKHLALSLALLACCLAHPSRAAEPTRLAPVADKAARMTAFQARHSPANLDRLGREMLARTYVPSWHPHEFNRPGGWEALKEVRARMDRGEFAQALNGFKLYTLDKLRDVDSHGLPRGRFDPFSTGINGAQWIRPLLQASQKAEVLAQAQELLGGVLSVGGQKLDIGPPGAVNWKAAVASANKGAQGGLWDLEAFYPLLGAYIFTGEPKYLQLWADYADDWAINQREGIGTTNIADVPNGWANGVETLLTLLRYLGGVVMVPNGASSLPDGTFARVFGRLLDDFVPVSILYHRSNPQNWNDTSLTALPDVGYFLDVYPIGRQLLHESRRRLDLLLSTHHLPDGTDLDTTVGYAGLFLLGAGTFQERIDTRQLRIPDWMLTKWEREEWRTDSSLGLWEQNIRAEMVKRARFLAAHTMPNGEFPIGGTRNGRRNESQLLTSTLRYFVPEAFQNPDIASIMALATGKRADGPPSFTSERFPYSGHSYMRAGWKPDDAYLYFYCAPQPMGGSLSGRNNNALGLSAWNYDLLETGDNGVYDQPHSPVKVDGQEQHFTFGTPAWGHRGPMLSTSRIDSPPPWRWHASPRFDVAEGIYDGNFGRDARLDGVAHQRLVHWGRESGLCIVTDRLKSREPHAYTLDWRLGIKPGVERDFEVEQIHVEAARDSIKTARPEGANISLYHFASAPLAWSTHQDRTPPTQGYRLHDFLRAGADWKATGESIVVTAIFPRQTQVDELSSIKPLSTASAQGFEATTPKGFRVLYQAATRAPGVLKVTNLSAEGESLMLSIGPDGSRRGVALGCKYLRIAGKAAAIPSADFEFEIVGATLKATPILTPLQPVRIAPSNTTAFTERQIVTLSCATPKAEIRYTLDGSEPTPLSPLYRGPITLSQSAVVKARSLRVGVQKLPSEMSGTLASDVTQAAFAQLAPAPAVDGGATSPGLRYKYYEGRWQDLLSGLHRLAPLKSGTVATLLDVSAKGVVPTYAFQYSGFLEVPQDGVYNFIAPPEFYEPSIMAAYELRLMLDGKEWYPAMSRHALGVWSVALAKGKHAFSLLFADLRADGVQKMNKPGMQRMVWDGATPDIQFSGPGVARGLLAAQKFSYAK